MLNFLLSSFLLKTKNLLAKSSILHTHTMKKEKKNGQNLLFDTLQIKKIPELLAP